MSFRQAIGVLGLAVLGACGGGDAESPPTLDDVIDRPIDTLSGDESRTVCEAVLAHTNPCLPLAMHASTTEECTELLSSCAPSALPTPSCHDVYFGPPGSCSVTVGEYLECIDDWNAAQTCDSAALMLSTPESCKKVVSSCVRLAGEFYRPGPFPSCKEYESPSPTDEDDDIHGFDGCRPSPARFVVLGDGIAACVGTTEQHCTANELAEYLNGGATSELVVEVKATPGAVAADLPAQAAQVEGGAGHILVYIATIETDLGTASADLDGWSSAWDQLIAYFTDPTRFPDGASFLLNTQYSLYDRCPNPPGVAEGIPIEEEELLVAANQKLFLDVAKQRTDTVAIDHYPDFLGHGRNANILGCHCQENNNHWLSYYDRTHPNSLGYEHMTAKWIIAFDGMYGPTCGN